MITVNITETIKKIASYASRIKTAKHVAGGNYTGLEADGAYYYGTIGELCLYTLLRERFVRSDYTLNLTQRSDNGDFMIYGKGIPVKADIKTATKPFHTRIMITKRQYEIHKSDLYIGARINGEVCEIWGYNRGIEDTIEQDYGAPSYNKQLSHLTPIETLIERADPGATRATVEGTLPTSHLYKLQQWFALNPTYGN